LVTFVEGGHQRIGVRIGNEVVDITHGDASLPKNMRQFLEGGQEALLKAHKQVESCQNRLSLDHVKILAPISDPEKVICIGLNYRDHAAESKMPIPEEPLVFSKFPSSIIGPGQNIVLPKGITTEPDYEVELVIVIGKTAKKITEEHAHEYIVGYTVGHDVSERAWQLRKGGQWLLGKSFDTFAPIGPEIVTGDELDPNHLDIRCILNGEVVQNSNTNNFIFKVEKVVSYLSQVITLRPGDIIFTGTPPGVGFARKPPIYLKHGDHVVCEIEHIGKLENPVVEE